MKSDSIRAQVRKQYAQQVNRSGEGDSAAGCCGSQPSQGSQGGCGCCGPTVPISDLGQIIGYSESELTAVPDGANLGLGCGNPQAIAALKPGETVLDLGAGAGFDCFLAARQVGESGRVIGVDMTPEMLSCARQNAAEGGFTNVEFRLGEIEHLPVADQSVDVIISNCVINLSPEKDQVFREAFRVLRPGGRLAISDIVAAHPLSSEAQAKAGDRAGCVAGAAAVSEVEAMLAEAGFAQIRVSPRESKQMLASWGVDPEITDLVFSATIEAVKPNTVG